MRGSDAVQRRRSGGLWAATAVLLSLVTSAAPGRALEPWGKAGLAPPGGAGSTADPAAPGPTSVLAQGTPDGETQRQDPAEVWRQRLLEIGSDLLAGEYSRAESLSAELGREMADTIVGGAGADLLLAMTTTYHALALAGLGRGEEAVWDWQVAQQLYPRVAEVDLTRFGSTGAFLSMHPPRTPVRDSEASPRTGRFEPPVKVDAPLPEFPDGRAYRGLAVDVVVQLVIDVEGRPREPLILEAEGEPTLVWSTLEALKRWRFEPARRDGEPEAALYRLTASFVVPAQ